MRVLFIDQYSELGGAQQCLLDLLPAVRESGWEAHAAVPGEGPLVERLSSMGAAVRPIPCGPLSSGHKSWKDIRRFTGEAPALASAIRDLATNVRADLLYVNGPRVLPAAAWAARKGPPVLFHCHSHLREKSARWLTGHAIRFVRATVVGCCSFAVQPLRPYVRNGGSYLVYNGIALPHSPICRKTDGIRLTVGVVGRISPEKGQKEFLQAARLLAKALPHCRFVVCGDVLFDDPEARRYRDSLHEVANGLPVQFLGWRADITEVMAQLDLLVVPSVWEPGAPRVVLEAYACGVPVVAFPSGGIPEIVQDGETGFLVDPPTPAALAERILTLVLRQQQLLDQAARAGHALWKERFTVEQYRRKLLEIMAKTAGHTEP